ncbi:MAG TPA: 50S ribosomal protein L28 [Bacteroidales bacterium]|nr:50S ribosomal protein L28 [Bacteroidales bacterium]
MAKECQLTGKRRMIGHNVSHSNIKTKRIFAPNLQVKKIFLPEEKRWIRLKVSTSALRTIDKKGISACLKDLMKKGYI